MVSPVESGEGRPLIYGHRGASAYVKENTLQAFTLAIDQGADGVELDVRFTADEEMVIHHDASVPELGSIIDCSLARLRDAAPDIPTLEEALTALPAPAFINVEIKNQSRDRDFDPKRRLADTVAAMLNELGVATRVVVSSFDPLSVERIRHLDPSIATGLLTATGTDLPAAIESAAAAGHNCVNAALADMGGATAAATVATARALGLGIMVWTVDEPDDAKRLRDAGVAGIITNDPPAALAALG